MNSVDETLKRTGFKVVGLELSWGALFVLLIIFAWVPYSTHGHTWLLWLPVLVLALIYPLAKRLTRQTQALRDALPAEAQEELKRREATCDQMQKKYFLIVIPVGIVWCVGLIFWGQHVLEKREREMKEELMLRMQQKQQRNAPVTK
jgi:hypothetical protein